MVDSITIQDRALLHKATVDLLTLLVDRVNSNSEDVNLTNMLLKRVWKAALKCPGFTPVMKDDIVYIAGIDEQTAKEHGVAPFASGWRDIYTIGPKVDAPHDLILVSPSLFYFFSNQCLKVCSGTSLSSAKLPKLVSHSSLSRNRLLVPRL